MIAVKNKLADKKNVNLIQQYTICTMASFYYYDQNPFRSPPHIQSWYSQRGLQDKSTYLHKKEKHWRILVVVVKWTYRANGL